eukprot:CAMPEP_0194028496 /NCGR_PEP_ID=MMETSP0009_2-20130614/2440_1 /TAXON_ID=210454 /ORGANISM="Grammatophora oceanica, Strain CCMP 410" /LENGTH=143 /DNA_ID=CAMNT_0038667903 /DNA_START=601 /DNA_END=1032 /DNA_ORIENTATION=-
MEFPESLVTKMLLAIPSTGNAQNDYNKVVNVLHLLSAASREFGHEVEAETLEKLVNSIGPTRDRDLATEIHDAGLAITSTGNAQNDYNKVVNVLHLLSAASREFGQDMEAETLEKLVNAIVPMSDRDLASEMNGAGVYNAFEG